MDPERSLSEISKIQKERFDAITKDLKAVLLDVARTYWKDQAIKQGVIDALHKLEQEDRLL